MSFEIQVTRRPGEQGMTATVVKLAGTLDIVSSKEAEQTLTPMLTTSFTKVNDPNLTPFLSQSWARTT